LIDMSFTETTSTSWFGRIKKALTGLLVGLLFLVGSIVLLIWNEGRAIQTYRALAEGAANVVSVDGAKRDPGNDGKLVHISAAVTVDGVPRDEMFGISAEKAVGLARDVEMYQWVESSESKTEKKIGGGEETTTTYSYQKEWRSGRVDSSRFKHPDDHANPDTMPDGQTFVADAAHVGAFSVPAGMVADIGQRTAVSLTDADAAEATKRLSANRPVKRDGQGLYVGQSSTSPEIGDLKISFERIDAREASFVGKQSGDALTAYISRNGRDIFLSAAGDADAVSMFKAAQSENTVITWILRLVGLVVMFIGFVLMFAIFGVLADIIPFVGSIVSFGTSLFAFVLTLLLGAVVIAIGWVAYRPLVAIGILVAAAVVAFLLVRRRRSAVAARPAAV
jgi:hypothetical protein